MLPVKYAAILKAYMKKRKQDNIALERHFRAQTYHLTGGEITFKKFAEKHWQIEGDIDPREAVKDEERMTVKDAQERFEKLTGKK